MTHHATQKLDDLCSRILSHFKDRFVVGEEVMGVNESGPQPCRIIAMSEPAEGHPLGERCIRTSSCPLMPVAMYAHSVSSNHTQMQQKHCITIACCL